MLYAGSDDGVYRIARATTDDATADDATDATRVLEGGRAYRVEVPVGLDGILAATHAGLYYSTEGTDWVDCSVPREPVCSVAASPDGERLYAGTFPAHVYVLDVPAGGLDTDDPPTADDWRELDGFQDLPSREEWHTPRHDDASQVRRLLTTPERPDRLVAGVEVGGVHVSADRGETWTERRTGVHDDVHHLALGGPDEFIASTGFGLFRSTDEGRSWTDLTDDVDGQYVRDATVHDGDVYAGVAHGPSPTWDEQTDHALLVARDGEAVEVVDSPHPDELVIGWTTAAADLLAATHRGTLLRVRERGASVDVVGSVPVPGETRGRYLPLAWVPE